MPEPSNVFGIDAYLLLLQQWHQRIIATASEADRLQLRSLWSTLTNMLCNKFASQSYRTFKRELFETNDAPPLTALERRLRDLKDAGLQEGFIAVSLRLATEQLIERNLPWALEQWSQLANTLLPRDWLSVTLDDEKQPVRNVYTFPPQEDV